MLESERRTLSVTAAERDAVRAQLSAAVATHSSAAQSASDELTSLRANANDLKRQLSDAQRAAAAGDSNATQTAHELDALRATHASNVQALADATRELAQLRTTHTSLIDERTQLATRLADVERERDAATTARTQHIVAAAVERDAVQARCDDLLTAARAAADRERIERLRTNFVINFKTFSIEIYFIFFCCMFLISGVTLSALRAQLEALVAQLESTRQSSSRQRDEDARALDAMRQELGVMTRERDALLVRGASSTSAAQSELAEARDALRACEARLATSNGVEEQLRARIDQCVRDADAARLQHERREADRARRLDTLTQQLNEAQGNVERARNDATLIEQQTATAMRARDDAARAECARLQTALVAAQVAMNTSSCDSSNYVY